MRGDEVPYEARRNTIRTYEELHQKFDAFLSGQIESNLLTVARWGIGKSFYLKGERRTVPVGVDAIKADIQRAQQEDKERLAINNDKEEDEEFDGHSLELSFGET